jgi:chromosome partitioning protein
MSYTIAVAQRKGGVGKTTLAVSVAAELHRRGKAVALIDADAQRSACQWAGPGNLQFPVYELALTDQFVHNNWYRELIRVGANYNYIVVDTPPNEQALSVSTGVSSLVLVPCTPSGLDLGSMVRTLEIIDTVRSRRRGHPSLILVPNRVDARTLEGRQLVEELVGFGEVVSPTIGDRSAFVRAFSAGRSVAKMVDGQVAHREIQMLCDVVEKCLGTSSVGRLGLDPGPCS